MILLIELAQDSAINILSGTSYYHVRESTICLMVFSKSYVIHMSCDTKFIMLPKLNCFKRGCLSFTDYYVTHSSAAKVKSKLKAILIFNLSREFICSEHAHLDAALSHSPPRHDLQT